VIFQLEENALTDIVITDLQGKVVKTISKELEAGLNSMTLTKTDLGTAGIYYMTVRTKNQTEMIKLVLMD